MKNKFNTATFLRQLTLLLIAVMLTASAAWAEDDVPSIDGLSYNSTGGYYEIPDADALNALASYVNSGHDCSGMSFKVTGNIVFNKPAEGESNFTAIGSWTKPFKGNFDGDGKKISGIRIYKPDDVNQGLFGCIYNANVENIILTDTQITGWQGVSGIAGYCHESTIRNCIVDNVFVNGSRHGCGGIAGSVNGSLVGNLVVNSTITVANPSEYIYTGAITGDSYDGSLENNYYYNCKVIVGETGNTTDVGCGQNGTLPHDIDGALQAVQISAAEGISFEITSNNSIPYKDQIYVGVGTTVTLTITDVNGYQYYTNGKGVYFTNVDGNSSNFTVTDANDIVITGTNEDPVEGKISISAIDDQITILPKGNAVLLDGKCYAEVGATVTLAITDIYKPDEGYTVSGYTYAEGESLTKNADGNYTFTVPSDDVTISRVITDVWNVENGADGSADHPYIITTPAGLDLLATKVNADKYYYKHFELGADIDYKDVPAKDGSGSNFTPIGKDRDYSFKGSFDGKEYTISGIVLNSENASFQGLFGYVGWSDDYSDNGPIVKNVTLASSTIKGSDLVGGIAGGSAGMISNCTVKSDVKIYAQECGGILEYNNGFVENCTSSAQLEGNSNVGGIAGESRRHGLANNRAIGVKISGTFQYAGAITPYTTNEDSLHNNFYLNCMVLDKTAGIGLDGEDFTKNNGAVPVHAITLCDGITITTDPSITYDETNYYAQGTELKLQKNIATTYYANGVEISGETFTMPAKDVTFTRDYIITYNLNGGVLPTGTDNPTKFTVESGEITLATPTYNYGTFGGWYNNRTFDGEPIATINSAEAKDINLYAKWDIVSITEIKTTDDLIYFANTVKAGNTYEGKTVTLMNDIDFEPSAETTENFDGIGLSSRPFSGTFDGGNHTIRGIRINKPNGDQYGLFCVLRGAVIKNIVLDNARIICNSNNGGIVGHFSGGTIIGCTITDKVTIISTQQGDHIGGIVGWFNKGTISDCVSKATITANEGTLFGGIAGWMESGTISHCTSYATIKVNQSSMGGFGGIVGFNVSGTIEDNLVIDATITINTAIGAIAGFNIGTLKNNFYYNTTVNDVNNATSVGCNGADIPDDNGAVHADLLIDGNSNDDVPTSTSTGNQTVVLQRTFSVGVNSTLMLPFGFTADADFQDDYGSFYSITSIGYNEQDKCWEAQLSDPVTQVEANKPYIFVPAKGVGFIPFNDVTIDESDPQDVTFGDKNEWTFKGVYSKVTLTSDADHRYFCFASAKESDGIKAGEFVKIGRNVGVKACRCYLVYSGTDSRLSKSATELPDRIVVIFPDGASSVITPDEPETPITGDDDITTPVSEIVPSVNVKVWSYDKTIFIESPAGTDYRIIDLNGRTLKSATTTTSRDEIHLGNASGIVIVIINGKTYKTLY